MIQHANQTYETVELVALSGSVQSVPVGDYDIINKVYLESRLSSVNITDMGGGIGLAGLDNHIRSLSASTGITLISGASAISISANVASASALGTSDDVDIYAGNVNGALMFKALSAGTGVLLFDTGTQVRIEAIQSITQTTSYSAASSYTYIIPANCIALDIEVLGGGAGGGSGGGNGQQVPATFDAIGGSAGGGGGYILSKLSHVDLTAVSSLSVVVGDQGTGGAGYQFFFVNSTGNAGTNGGNSYVYSPTLGYISFAGGGKGGVGGTPTPTTAVGGLGGAVSGINIFHSGPGTQGGSSVPSTGGTAGSSVDPSHYGGAGGGAGAPAFYQTGYTAGTGGSAQSLAGGTPGNSGVGSTSTPGGNGQITSLSSTTGGTGGGGGGAAQGGVAAGFGSAGGSGGAGAGGGGAGGVYQTASQNHFVGAGGNGGKGLVRFTAYIRTGGYTQIGNGVKMLDDSALVFRSLSAGTGISLISTADNVSIVNTLTSETISAFNVGVGNGVFKQKTAATLEFKSLSAGSNVTISPIGDTLVFDVSGGIATIYNVGTGAQLWDPATTSLRTIAVAGTGLALISSASAITLSSNGSGGGGGTTYNNIGAGVQLIDNSTASIRTLSAGTNVTLVSSASTVRFDVDLTGGGGVTYEVYDINGIIVEVGRGQVGATGTTNISAIGNANKLTDTGGAYFRSLSAGNGVTILSAFDTLTISTNFVVETYFVRDINNNIVEVGRGSQGIQGIAGPVLALSAVAARYSTAVSQSIATTATNLAFELQAFDTHNAASGAGTSWIWTVPTTGKYQAEAEVYTGVAATGLQSVQLFICVNGSSQFKGINLASSGSIPGSTVVTGTLSLSAGDIITIQCLSDLNTSRTLGGGSQFNHFSIALISGIQGPTGSAASLSAIGSGIKMTDTASSYVRSLSAGTGMALVSSSDTVRVDIVDSGWIDPGETWTFATATTFTITGDKTGRYNKGDKIRLTQTTQKYFYIIAVAFSSVTTITVTGGSDYTLANAAITSPGFSKWETPQGFPQWFNWTPVFTGFSADPTTIFNRFNIRGTMVTCTFRQVNAGTSNSTGFTMTGPVTAANPSGIGYYLGMVYGTDGGALNANVSWATIGGGNIISFGKAFNNGNWTASGGKKVDPGSIVYELA